VQEKANSQIGGRNLQQRGQKHQLIVMNPNQIVVVSVFEHLLGEFVIHALVVLPPGGLVPQVIRQVVQQRPDARVGKTFVMCLDILFAKEHRDAAIFFPQNALDLPLS
jgi:hypothetical protein